MGHLIFALVVSLTAFARPAPPAHKGMLEIRKGARLYVNHKPAVNGKPTLFLLNGLTYSTKEWSDFTAQLQALDPEIGIVLYDMQGMGRTLLEHLPPLYDIPIENQVEDLKDLVQKLNIDGPIAALGLSYGGAIALKFAAENPRVFDQVIAMAPFLERLPEQDTLIKRSVAAHRTMFPLDPRSDEELYDWYLRGMVSTYPLTEPVILENPFKLEAVYRMVKGAKNWNAAEAAPYLPHGRVHVVAARADEYVKFDRMQYFLSKVPKGRLASLLVIQDPPLEFLLPTQKFHKIPELRPRLSAHWVYEILTGNPDLQKGLTFWADPTKGEARSGKIKIPLENADDCEAALRKARGPR